MGCSPDRVSAYPAPVSTPPPAVSAVTCCTPRAGGGPATGWPRCQLSPSDDHQATMAWAPGGPARPAATNPAPAAVSAVTVAGPAGPRRPVSCQWRPPSVETAANATEPAADGPAADGPAATCVAALPTATTRPSTAATLVSAALTVPGGSGSAMGCQAEPVREVHTAGSFPFEPTAANPDRSVVTASIWPGGPGAVAPPVPTAARVQAPRPIEYQAAGAGLPPGAGALPTTTYAAGPTAAWVSAVPGAANCSAPAAGRQVRPSADVTATAAGGGNPGCAGGPAWPTASQPEPPGTTPVRLPRCQAAGMEIVAGAQRPPAGAHHKAGAPSAVPAATCSAPAAARLFTVTSAVLAAASTAAPTVVWCAAVPAPASRRYGLASAVSEPGRCRSPAATTMEPGATVTPVTIVLAALPWSAVLRQPRPVALTKATRETGVVPDTTNARALADTVRTRSGTRGLAT